MPYATYVIKSLALSDLSAENVEELIQTAKGGGHCWRFHCMYCISYPIYMKKKLKKIVMSTIGVPSNGNPPGTYVDIIYVHSEVMYSPLL